MNGSEEIGCCGAYCKTCREFEKTCKCCKPGYLDGSRDLSTAKCRMKKCCLTRGHITCADCGEYEHCETIQAFLNHSGYKYSKYKQALEFIRGSGLHYLPESGRTLDKRLWQVPETGQLKQTVAPAERPRISAGVILCL